MFGPPGMAYVYLVYGMYDCLNVVTEPAGSPAALLIRAVEPIEGMDLMRQARIERTRMRHGARGSARHALEAERILGLPDHRLASGPGLVGAAFGLDPGWTGLDLCDPASALRLEIEPRSGEAPRSVVATPRIGIDGARPPWTEVPWRLSLANHPSVSGPRAPRR